MSTLLFSNFALATDRTWDGEGNDNNWNTPENWSGDAVPDVGDVAIFNGTSIKNCTINTSPTIAALYVNSGYTGVMTANSSITLQINSTYSQNDGTVDLSAATLDMNGSFTVSAGTFNPPTTNSGSGDFKLGVGTFTDASSTYTDTDLFIDGYNIVFDSTQTFKTLSQTQVAGNYLYIPNSKTLTISGAATFTTGFLYGNGTLDLKGSSVTFDSTWSGSGGASDGRISFTSSGSPSITLGLLANSYWYPRITLNSAGTTLTLSGASAQSLSPFTLTDGTFNIETTANFGGDTTIQGGTLDFKTSNKTHTVTGLLTVSGGTIQSSTGSGNTFHVTNAYSQSGGSVDLSKLTFDLDQSFTLSSGTFNPPTTANGTGDFKLGAGTFTDASSTYTDTDLFIDGTNLIVASTQTFKTFSQTQADNNYISINNGVTLTISGDATFTTGFLYGNGTLDLKGSSVTFDSTWSGSGGASDGRISFTSSGSPSITLGLLANSYWYPRITLNSAGTTLTLSGASAQSLSPFTLTDGTFNIETTANFGGDTTIQGGTLDFKTSNKTHTVTGLLTVSGGTIQSSTGSGNTFHVTNAYSQSGGSVDLSKLTFDLDQSFTLSSGTFNPPTTANGTGDFKLGVGTFTDASSTYTDTDLFIDGYNIVFDSTQTFKTLSQTQVAGNYLYIPNSKTLTISGAATFTTGFLYGNGTLDLKGSSVTFDSTWSGSGGASDGRISFTSSGSPSITLGLLANSYWYPRITLNSAGTTLTLSGASAQSLSPFTLTDGTFNIETTANFGGDTTIQGGTLDFKTSNKTHTVTGLLTVSGGTIQSSTGSGNTFHVTNAYSQSGGSVDLSKLTFDLDQSFTLSSGTFNPPTTANGTGDFKLGAGTFTDASSTYTDTDLFIDGTNLIVASTQTFKTFSQTQADNNYISINNGVTLTISGDATFTTGFLYGNGTLDLKGSSVTFDSTWSGSGGASDGRISFTSAGTPSITLNVLNSSYWYPRMTINSAGTTLAGPGTGGTLLLSPITSFDAGTLDLNGSNLTVNNGSSSMTLGSAAILKLHGDETVTLSSSPTLSSGSIVIYSGTDAAYTLKNWTYDNLTINGGGSSVFTLPGNKTISSALRITSGILYSGGHNLTVSGTLYNDSTLRLTGDETLSGISDTDSGTIEYTSGGTCASLPITDYFHLKIDGADCTLGDDIDLNGSMILASGSLTAGTHTINVAGNWMKTSGSFVKNTSTVIFDGTDQVISGSTDFYNLTKQVSSAHSLTFTHATSNTVSHRFVANGVSGNKLSLASSSPGTTTNLSIAHPIWQYVDLQDINNNSGADVYCLNGCTDSGNNQNINFSVSGALTNTWAFNDATPASVFDFNSSYITVNSSADDLAKLKDITGSGSYGTVSPLPGWNQRKPITINNGAGAPLTDFQVKVTVLYDNDMQADFDDIRFVDSNGTLLSAWLETKTDSTSALFWVKVPTIPVMGTTIYMYYGNTLASSYSDGTNTFLFFDGFDGSSVDAGWTASHGSYQTVSGGYLHSNTLSLNADTVLTRTLSISTPAMYEQKLNVVDNNGGTRRFAMHTSNSNNYYNFIGWENSTVYVNNYNGSSWGAGPALSNPTPQFNTEYIIRSIHNNDDNIVEFVDTNYAVIDSATYSGQGGYIRGIEAGHVQFGYGHI